MILRKPYAFFIKYFKLLHTIIAVFVAFLLYRSFTLYNFFRVYVDDYSTALNDMAPRSLLNIYSFLMVLGVIILIIVLLSVMIYKNKPKKLYIYSLIVYVAVIVLYGITQPVLRDISASLLDMRFASALRDFFMIALILQAVSFVLYIVRATGFDIKQFDFGTDLQKLDIDEKDSEEIEVALEFDKNKVNRQIRYNFRQLKYIYGEHKLVINTAVVILLILIGFNIYFNISIYTAYYDQGESFSASGVVMNIKDTYLTQEDPLGNKLTDNMVVVVKMDIKKQGGVNKTLNTGLATLRIGNNSYGQNNDYAKELYDLGTPYTNQELGVEFQNYILAFVVPKEEANKKMMLKFNDDVSYVKGEIGAKDIMVNLDPISLSGSKDVKAVNLKEMLSLEDSILGNSSLTINSFEINDTFKINYKFAYGTDKYVDSIEYLTPTATGTYFKTLMKINADFNLDKNVNISSVTTFADFLNSFATINYKLNGVWTSQKINTQNIKPRVNQSSSSYYVEVPRDVKNATEINFSLKIRNNVYKYILK